MLQGAAKHRNAFEQLEAIKANDERALKALYKNNYYKIEHYVINNNGSAEQAKDVYQEAFIAVWRNIQLDKFQPENETALDGYLYRIAKNKWMDFLRSGYYNKTVRMDDVVPDEEAEVMSEHENEYLQAVRKHFKELGGNCKKLLTKFYYDNESLRKIGEEMGWTEATARNNKYRCIQKLKELINQNKSS
jgi:RNA polymerase sigma factor (sigma-70 family)